MGDPVFVLKISSFLMQLRGISNDRFRTGAGFFAGSAVFIIDQIAMHRKPRILEEISLYTGWRSVKQTSLSDIQLAPLTT